MGSKIYVGGLPYSATEQQLSDLFGAHGAVASARIITDKFTGQSRGFGFVEMSSDSEAQAAISALNGSDMGLAPVVAAAVVDSGAVEAVAQAASGTAGKSYRSERIQEGVP
jgi:RNA recognition motif-containing protein